MVHPGKSSDLQVSGLQDVGFRIWVLGFRGLGACCRPQVYGSAVPGVGSQGFI